MKKHEKEIIESISSADYIRLVDTKNQSFYLQLNLSSLLLDLFSKKTDCSGNLYEIRAYKHGVYKQYNTYKPAKTLEKFCKHIKNLKEFKGEN